jgi:hypothetical protein
MHPPLFIRPLTADEPAPWRAGLHAAEAFPRRRCQILLARDQGQDAALIARNRGCAKGTALNALRDVHARGLACRKPKSSRPPSARPCLTEDQAPALEDLLHHSPRLGGPTTSLWALALVAPACFAHGWAPRPLTGAAIRQAPQRLGISWQRAKHSITSPDPASARKKTRATG